MDTENSNEINEMYSVFFSAGKLLPDKWNDYMYEQWLYFIIEIVVFFSVKVKIDLVMVVGGW